MHFKNNLSKSLLIFKRKKKCNLEKTITFSEMSFLETEDSGNEGKGEKRWKSNPQL